MDLDTTLSVTALFSATNLKPPSDEPMVALLVDQNPESAQVISKMLDRERGLEIHVCKNPAVAERTIDVIKPTVIILSLELRDADGLQLISRIRETEIGKDTPLIALSSRGEAWLKLKAFATGANDYLINPPEQLELITRVRYHSTAQLVLKQRNVALEALRNELTEAAAYVRSLLPPERSEPPLTQWRYIPSAQLGGDSFGYNWIDDDHLAIYLMDVCGHGIGPALLSVSVINALANGTLPNVDFREPAQVLESLNTHFQMEQHRNMFITIWYGVYDRTRRALSYSSGGHPPAILATGPNPAAASIHALTTSGFAVGALPHSTFSSTTCALGEFASLLLYSDGAYEFNKVFDGTMMTLAEYTQVVADYFHRGEVDLDAVVAELRMQQGKREFEDDFSLLQVVF